jgi:hypothetical protein
MRLLLLLCGELGILHITGAGAARHIMDAPTGALRVVGAMLLHQDPAARMEISAKFY